ncbi:unnamed protein product [Closterium sp. NIES-65]|nr:unnamed protein product [Closterium sp. NIES-65]
MDHFLSVCPTTLTVDLLEKALLVAEKSIVDVGASRCDPRTPVFEGCSPSPLLPSVASAATADLVGFESVGAASAPSGRRCTGKGKGGKGAGGTGEGGGGGGGGSRGSGGGGGSGAGESALSGTTSAHAFHTFTLDSDASRSFFQDPITLTPLSQPDAVSLIDPSRGLVLASFSTVLPCPAAPSGTLSGLYLPSFSTNLVSGADLQDRGVDQFTPASQRVTHCTCARTGRHLATFTRRPGSSLLSSGTTALVTPPCLVSEAWPPVSLSLVSLNLSLP